VGTTRQTAWKDSNEIAVELANLTAAIGIDFVRFPYTSSVDDTRFQLDDISYDLTATDNPFGSSQRTLDPEIMLLMNEAGVPIMFQDPGQPEVQDPGQSGQPAAPSNSDLAMRLADPTAAIGKLNLFYDHTRYDGNLPGADRQYSNTLIFQPSLPYPLTENSRLFLRPAIPLFFDQPFLDPSTGTFDDAGVQLGDIGYDFAYGGNDPSGFIYLVGVNGTFPTATDKSTGSDQWTLGPEIMIGHASETGVAGVLLTQRWDIASTSSNAPDVNVTGGQYFYSLPLDDGWTFGAAPTFSYNHEATSGNKFTFPIAAGFQKTTQIGDRPVRFGFEVWYNVERADAFAPEWVLRFSISPVVQLPW
jgi:hypothetical protein